MSQEEGCWSRDHYLISAFREDKAARESATAEARLAHLKLAKLYRERAAGLRNENRGMGAIAH